MRRCFSMKTMESLGESSQKLCKSINKVIRGNAFHWPINCDEQWNRLVIVMSCHAMPWKAFRSRNIPYFSIWHDFDKWSAYIPGSKQVTAKYCFGAVHSKCTYNCLQQGSQCYFRLFNKLSRVEVLNEQACDENVQRLWFMTVAFNRHSGWFFFLLSVRFNLNVQQLFHANQILTKILWAGISENEIDARRE